MIFRTSSTRLARLLVVLGGLLATLPTSRLFAQGGEDDPLDFRGITQRVGLEVGFTSVWQSGTYSTGCGLFGKGAGANFLIAAAYDRKLGGSPFQFEALLGYQSRNVMGSYISNETIGISTESGPVDARVSFDNIGEANFSYVFLQPSLKFYPFDALYGGVGVGVNVLLSASTQYSKNILSKTIQLNELGLSEVSYSENESSDPYSKVFPAESRNDAAAVTFDGIITVGAEFTVARTTADVTTPLSTSSQKKLVVGPRLQYVIPFVNALSDGENAMRLNGLQFLVGFRYGF